MLLRTRPFVRQGKMLKPLVPRRFYRKRSEQGWYNTNIYKAVKLRSDGVMDGNM